MSKSASFVLTVFLGMFAPTVQSHAMGSARVAMVAPQLTAKPASEINVFGLAQASYAETRGHTRNCANFAALRALAAKASGSDFAIQSRVLNLTFLLCMHGASESD